MTANETETTSDNVTWDKIALGVALYVIVVITIFGNGLVLIAIKREKKLQTVFNYYIVNLAVTDFAVALTAMSFYTLNIVLGYWPFGKFMCGVWIFFDYGMTFASVFTLIVISVDRFWSVTWTLHYKSHHSKRKAIRLIIAIWVFMLVLWLPPCILDRIQNATSPKVCIWDPALNREYVFVIATIGHHGSFLIMSICYIKVLVVVKRQRTKIRAMPPAVSNMEVTMHESRIGRPYFNAATSVCRLTDENTLHPTSRIDHESGPQKEKNQIRTHTDSSDQAMTGDQGTKQIADNKTTTSSKEKKYKTKETRVFITLSYIIIGYMICWVPWHFVFDISAFRPSLISNEFFNITFWMTYLNSTINPFLYNFSSPEFRDAFKRTLRIRKCRSTE